VNICHKCKEIDEREFNSVKDYIYENPCATFKDTVVATGVKASRIRSYLRNGRLLIPDSSPIFINCENCGASIKYGRICKQCANTLSNEMKKEMNIEEYQIGESPKRDGFYSTAFSGRFNE
jgi:ribosomal protein L32